ncbi:MAG TPA: DUF167 domain-containing protein [Rubrobacter sp.]|nr:DUF167 domain-containing protein [Rubrobacter sp.]
MSKGFVASTRDGAILNIRVSPGASRTSIDGAYGEGALKLRLAAPPVDGKANAEAERYVAKLLGVAKSDVSVVRGASSRNKAILARGAAAEDVRERLCGRLP